MTTNDEENGEEERITEKVSDGCKHAAAIISTEAVLCNIGDRGGWYFTLGALPDA